MCCCRKQICCFSLIMFHARTIHYSIDLNAYFFQQIMTFCFLRFLLLLTAHVQLFSMLNGQPILQYFAWVGFPVVLVVFSAGFVHLVSANAIGKQISTDLFYSFSWICLYIEELLPTVHLDAKYNVVNTA